MNCIIIDDDDLSRTLLTQIINDVENLKLTGSFSNGKDALGALKSNEVHLVFLDIEMPEMTGLELLAGIEFKPLVILTSSHEKYAIDAFDHEVVDYLLKPVTLPRFLKAVSKAEKKFDRNPGIINSTNTDNVFIRKDGIIIKLPVADILWIEALGDYVTVHTKAKKYILHQTMKSIESKLPGSKFCRVHRSYIVQTDNISTIEDTSIYIEGNPIPLGALFKENFLKRLGLLG